jgi:hypothetical protein
MVALDKFFSPDFDRGIKGDIDFSCFLIAAGLGLISTLHEHMISYGSMGNRLFQSKYITRHDLTKVVPARKM